ncbi:molecular chaperone DnaK [Paenibacillus polysaccharolyticus]|uniref:Chaperone protein DnaK n=1 Tax=Paenibacillus polysaccharolyticus TaxID=582692 RepID=A0A1G5BEJ2_9BACL|nr:Hsp70 family protein [Paenibacillus polysaccharolyticus]SCX88547.1 molecular chaperone DnaK [Paenibacillus polysaccharolyticus]
MYYGIDLGTTNSVISFGYEIPTKGIFEVRPINNQDSKHTSPSVVYFEKKGEPPIVGESALNAFNSDPRNTVRWVKRKMGLNKEYDVLDKSYTPQEISAFILKELKEYASKTNLKDEINSVVITVPADFDTAAKQATKDAGRIAGFENVHLIPEPNAAILNYIYKNYELNKLDESFSSTPQYLLVFDLGGGTFDVSLSSIHLDAQNKPQTSVISSSGNKYLGGYNFDKDLMIYSLKKAIKIYPTDVEALEELLEHAKNYPDLSNNVEIEVQDVLARIISESEVCKKDLSKNNRRVFSFYSHKGKYHRIEIDKEEFQMILEPYFEIIKSNIDNVLKDASEKTDNQFDDWNKLFGVLLVGGSTVIPAVRTLCKDIFGIDPIEDIDTYTAVANGAAIYASIIDGESTILSDYNTVVPHNYGIKSNQNFIPVLNKGDRDKNSNFEYEIPFALDTKAPIEIVQQYYDENGNEIYILLETINYSHPFMFTGDQIGVSFQLDDDLILSVSLTEKCIEDKVEATYHNKIKMSDENIDISKQKILA